VYAHLCLVLRSGLSSRRSVDVNGGERCCGEFPSALDHIVGAGGCPVIFWVLRSENRWTRFLWMESMSLLRVRTVFVSSFDNLPCVEPKKIFDGSRCVRRRRRGLLLPRQHQERETRRATRPSVL
jgi:hypothetical protein